MSGSIVEYDGFLASGAATLSPALRFDAPNVSVGGQASWTVFESGNQIFQASAAAAWLAPSRSFWRLELSGAGGASQYADQPATGHLLARGRLHIFGLRQGAWIGAATGASFDSIGSTPLEFGLGAWTAQDRFAFVSALNVIRVSDERYVDVSAAARWTSPSFELEARAGARPWLARTGIADESTRIWAELVATIPLASHVSFVASGGSYPSDAVRRVLGARHISLGLRFDLTDRAPAPAIPATVAATLAHRKEEDGSNASLEIVATGELRTLRLHVAGATSVELMADFTDWQPMAMEQRHAGVWEIQLPVERGVHRMNIRIDAGAWSVPAGARTEMDEFGGVVGVVVIE